jgi:hypothetical protein
MCGCSLTMFPRSFVGIPIEIDKDIKHPFLSHVAIGTDFLIFTTSFGSLLGLGNKFSVGLAPGDEQTEVYLENLEPLSLQNKVIDVVCGQRYAVALTEDHEIWGCGNYKWKLFTDATDMGWSKINYQNVSRLVGGEKYFALLHGNNQFEFSGYIKYMDVNVVSNMTLVDIYGGIDYIIARTSKYTRS